MGSSSNRAADEANRMEQERQARVAEATRRINAVFDDPSREGQRQDFATALRDFYTQDATRQQGVADRQRRFAMARGGLTGGSADVDSRRTLGEEFIRGLTDAENRTQAGLADLTAQDEAARLQLTQLAQSGLDATTAASRAGAAMRSSAQGAMSQAMSQGLGNVFKGTADTYTKQQEAAERRRGYRDIEGSLYGRGWGG